jgi:hypothetical protein
MYDEESLYTFEKYIDTDGTVMVQLPQRLGLIQALSNPARDEWREACREEFADDPDLVHFTDALCDAMEKFLAEE